MDLLVVLGLYTNKKKNVSFQSNTVIQDVAPPVFANEFYFVKNIFVQVSTL